MARIIKRKELIRTRLLKEYGSWIYCDACGENIGYLCYATMTMCDLIINVAVVIMEVLIWRWIPIRINYIAVRS